MSEGPADVESNQLNLSCHNSQNPLVFSCPSSSAWDDFRLAWLLRHHLMSSKRVQEIPPGRQAHAGHLPLVRPQLLAIRGADQQSENLSRLTVIPTKHTTLHVPLSLQHPACLQVIVKVPFRCLSCICGQTPMAIRQTLLKLLASGRCAQRPAPSPAPGRATKQLGGPRWATGKDEDHHRSGSGCNLSKSRS